MKFLLINQPMFNRGDESAHKALVYALLQRFPECRIEVLFAGRPLEAVEECKVNDVRVEYTNLQVTERYLKTYLWNLMHYTRLLWYFNPVVRRIVRKYRQADWVISSPGDRSLGPKCDWDHLFFVNLAEYAGCKVAYYGRSIGPFRDDSPSHLRFNFFAKRTLRRARFVSLRDPESVAVAKGLGVDCIQTLDTAFLYTPMVQVPVSVAGAIGDGPYIVLVPNYFLDGKSSPIQVRLFFAELTRRILDQFGDCKVVMLPQLFCGTDYASSDYSFFKDIAKDVADDRVVVLPDTLISEYHQAVISGARCVVGARYHSIVFAINNNVPFVTLNYEDRISGMLRLLDKQDRVVDITLALEQPKGRRRLDEIPTGKPGLYSLTFEAEVALARILDKMKLLERDENATGKAKSLTSLCFDAFAEMLGDSSSRKKNKRVRNCP